MTDLKIFVVRKGATYQKIHPKVPFFALTNVGSGDVGIRHWAALGEYLFKTL